MSAAYGALKAAVRRRGGICTAHEVRHELSVYLKQFRVKAPDGIRWSEIYTREEYNALVNSRRKRKPKRKKGEADPILFVYDSIEDKRVEARQHNVKLDQDFVEDLAWVDKFAARLQAEADANAYHGEF